MSQERPTAVTAALWSVIALSATTDHSAAVTALGRS